MEENYYEKKSEYEKEIAPIVQQLKSACNLAQLPMFVTVAYENTPEDTKYSSDMVLASTNTHLTDNRIGAALLLLNGFETQYPKHIQNALRDITEFVDKVSAQSDEENMLEFKLTKDVIEEIRKAVLRGDKVKPPRELVEKVISEDFDSI